MSLVVNKGHSGDITCLCFSPDGSTLVTGSGDESVRLWDVATGRELRTFEGPHGAVKSIVFSPDGKRVAGGDEDTNITVWNASTGKQEHVIPEHNNWVSSVCISPNGKLLASCSDDGTVRIFSFPDCNRKAKIRGHVGHVKSLAFSQDGERLVSAGFDNTVRIWNVRKGVLEKTFDQPNSFEGTVSFIPGSALIAATNTKNASIDFLDSNTGAVERSLPKDSAHGCFSCSPDGTTMAVVDYDKLALWRLNDCSKIRALTEVKTPVKAVAFSKDGSLVAAGGDDHIVRVWKTENGLLKTQLSGKAAFPYELALSDDGKTLATAFEDCCVRLWDIDGRDDVKVLAGLEEFVRTVDISRDGLVAASGGSETNIRFWNQLDGSDMGKITDDTPLWLNQLRISPDGRLLAIANSFNRSVSVYDIKARKLCFRVPSGGETNCICFSQDGKHLLSGGCDKKAYQWNSLSGNMELELKGFPESVGSVAYAPGDRCFVCSSGGILFVYKSDGTLSKRVPGVSSPVVFSSDGNFLASAAAGNAVKIWDARNELFREMHTLKGHSFYITSLVFGKNSKWLISSSGDGLIKFWDYERGIELCTLCAIGKKDWAVVDLQGRFDASNLDNLTDLFWRTKDRKTGIEQMLPVEVFMRQYYTPRLLARQLNFEKLPPIASISSLSRTLPEISITKISPNANQNDKVDVTVSFKSVNGHAGEDPSGVYDVRLLRNGQLVAYLPEDESFAEENSKDLSEGMVGKEFQKTLSVRLPHNTTEPIKFTAYAFNKDKVKSVSFETEYSAKDLKPEKGRAFVVGIGVNKYDDSNWNLRYATNDARGFTEGLAESLRSTGQYREVIPVAVVSEEERLLKPTDILATKENIRKLIAGLAGSEQVGDLKSALQSLRVTKAGPDDVLILAISSHGDTDKESGEYYLFPSNIGTGRNKGLTDELKKVGISSSELTDWLREVDAGDIALIIDACHSGAAEGKDFRPGPIDSRGLGQLAYYKRMRILSASQTDAKAKERADLRHGLLSYALLVRGLQENKADVNPVNGRITMSKWLRFGEQAVPKIDLKMDTDYVAQKDAAPSNLSTRAATPQVPKLLDFAGKRGDIVIQTTE